MSVATSKKPLNSKSASTTRAHAKSRAKPRSKPAPVGGAISQSPKPMAPSETRPQNATKQERVLTLLNRSEGASVEEIMTATDWLQHSVRGFLAGTVKKKLGFTLISTKTEGAPRRYRIEKRRER
jgi:hypothetical protein